MNTSLNVIFPPNLRGKRPPEEERERITMFDVVYGKMREKVVLQRLVVIARFPSDPDRTQLAAHFEKLTFQLSKQHVWDHITGLLLIYPSCLLHVIESSRDILISVLKDVETLQQHPDGSLLEAKIIFTANSPRSRLFQRWSYKVLHADQVSGSAVVNRLEEDEESTEGLVCGVASALQELSKRLETPEKVLPGSALDETPELIVSLETLEKLFGQNELPSPQQYLQMYDTPLNTVVEFGKVNPRSFLPTL